ncbi:MAG: ferrous iron transport protein B [Methylacidiphilales bacterium]|nr:ferrous iron transport protein B [Candidatus Methylacidiphilales bacterium]
MRLPTVESLAEIANPVGGVALAGNPNSGKSTLFNALTGLRQKVANYPGVTVEKKTGRFYGIHGRAMDLLDLPGTYSLQTRSPDEEVSRDVLLGRRADTPPPRAIVCVADATNLERNLYLVAQLAELDVPLVLALNMVDLAEKQGIRIDVNLLEKNLGIPVVPAVASAGVGLQEIKQLLSGEKLLLPKFRAPMPEAVAAEAEELVERLLLSPLPVPLGRAYSEALLLLSLDNEAELLDVAPSAVLAAAAEAAQGRLKATGIDPASAIIEARYAWIHQACAEAVRKPTEQPATFSDTIDNVLTHKVWGWLALAVVFGLMFFCIFTVANYPMNWINAAVSWLAGTARALMPPGDLRSLITDGVIAGVGGVVVFLPQILILFFFLGLLEDTGYMARAAFIMDRVMSRVGLHGKSFIPLLSSFACAIPGIMATRTIENKKDRLVTILIAPLMSCSARLPVYSLLIGAMIPDDKVPSLAKAGIMLAMYFFGIAAAFMMASLFKSTLFRNETPLLLLELPPYRMPQLRTIAMRMWERATIFLKRAGTVILAISILLWALATYPKPTDPNAGKAEALSHSMAGQIGHVMEPVIRPLGYDWKIGIGLLSSFAAREAFVGTMAVVYNVGEDDANSVSLRHALQSQQRPDGSPVFSPLVCVSLMVYYALAMQCMSTVAVVRRETNGWKWPLFLVAYMTGLAYLAALFIYQIGHLFHLG